MSVQGEISRLENAKAAIKAAVEGKGVSVPDGTLLDGMAALIESIQAGGGASWVTVATELPNDMYQLGDVNMDGSITQDDAEEIFNFLSGESNLTPIQQVLADFDFDRKILYTDAMNIMAAINGTYTPPLKWATAVECAAAATGDDVKAIFEITVNGDPINAPTYACVPWDGIIAIYSGAMIPAGTKGLIQILK